MTTSYRQASLRFWTLFTVVTLAVFGLVAWGVHSRRPPDHFRLATGPEGGIYYSTGEAYQQLLAAEGLRVDLVPTAGAVEALDLLRSGDAEAAFFQNGAESGHDTTGIVSLASIYYELVWVFYRAGAFDGPVNDLRDLRGRRISVGDDGSGTQVLARKMLDLNGIGEDDATLVPVGGLAAEELLLAGETDAAIYDIGVGAELVQTLLNAPGIEAMNFRRAEAYSRLLPYLEEVMLPEGALSLADDLPPEDKRLLATKTLLIAREDFHPDLQYALLTAARRIHAPGGPLHALNQFPAPAISAIPVSVFAERFLAGRPTPLEQYLPFWLASPLERFYLLVLPLLLLLYPLVRGTPGLYGSYMSRRVYRWYGAVRDVELGMADYDAAQTRAKIDDLTALDQQLARSVKVPARYLSSLYQLRTHIRLVVEHLRLRLVALEQERQKEQESAQAVLPAEPELVAQHEPYDGAQR
jgi:TRAP transporter TAXI family solute receptor